jgi:hypothetical protein
MSLEHHSRRIACVGNLLVVLTTCVATCATIMAGVGLIVLVGHNGWGMLIGTITMMAALVVPAVVSSEGFRLVRQRAAEARFLADVTAWVLDRSPG